MVTDYTPPSYVKVLPRLAAVVAERSSPACHFATVAREFGIPFLTSVTDARSLLDHGSEVTVDGDAAVVYRGAIDLQGQPSPVRNTPYYNKLGAALRFVEPLRLTDPSSKTFAPQGCRSLHDIIRYCHEKAVQAIEADFDHVLEQLYSFSE